MKQIINIYQAKKHLSRLADEAAQGADIIIARGGKPIARLCRLPPKAKKRKLGVLEGRFKIPQNFNAPLPGDALAAFEGTG